MPPAVQTVFQRAGRHWKSVRAGAVHTATLAMSLRTTVRLAIIGVTAGSIAIIAVMAAVYLVLEGVQRHAAFANAVSTDVGKFDLLTAELFLQRSPLVLQQWNRQHEILTRRLADMPTLKGQAAVLTREIVQRLETVKRIVDNTDRSEAQKAREIVSESVIAQGGAILSQATELSEVLASAAARTRKQVFLVIGGGFLLVVIGGGLVLFLISNRLLSRILSLRSVIQKIGEGDLETEIPAWMQDEMGELFHQLDQMRRSLLGSMGELSRVNLELIAAKAGLEDRVAERTAGLEAANRELEAFTYAVSHDLRGPLRRIAGFSQAVLEDHGEQIGEEGADMLRRAHRATQQMNQLVDDLLALSKLNQTPIDVSDVNLSKIASEICATLQDGDPERDVTVKIEPRITLRCNSRLMTIALTNLIENAWKFSAGNPKAEIQFGQHIDAGSPVVFVRDNGAGFDMAFREKLFQPFQRLHSAKEFAGTGIGLATVARIIRLHGGKIWAESRPREGATFFFQLGLAAGACSEAGDREPGPNAAAGDSARPAMARKAAGAG